MTIHFSKSYKLIKYTLNKRDDAERHHPEWENIQYQNQIHEVYRKFLKKQNHKR